MTAVPSALLLPIRLHAHDSQQTLYSILLLLLLLYLSMLPDLMQMLGTPKECPGLCRER